MHIFYSDFLCFDMSLLLLTVTLQGGGGGLLLLTVTLLVGGGSNNVFFFIESRNTQLLFESECVIHFSGHFCCFSSDIYLSKDISRFS